MAFLAQTWPWIVAAVNIVVAVIASAHAVLNKRNAGSTVAWIVIIWLTPIIGALLYVWLGINRMYRRVQRLRSGQTTPQGPDCTSDANRDDDVPPARCGHLVSLVRLGRNISHRPLLDGNRVTPLLNGEEAFPMMLDAIDTAEFSITLCTYIFDNDGAGKAFANSLIRAANRGVEVRVLVDDVGARYTRPPGINLLSGSKVKSARFLPASIPWHFRYSNLRNHRKILVVDGTVGFTGGMNVRETRSQADGKLAIRDMHFRIDGPAVHQLQEVLALDWSFTTGELLEGDCWYRPVAASGQVLARAISDGPDEDIDRMQNVLEGALSCATSNITIMTPYFIPDYALISALNIAALRGVQVDIILPARGNLRMVQWASIATLPQLIESGCRIWLSPPPFDHTKLMVIDGLWSFIGSTNWDPRSLRLNFELNVECYDAELARRLHETAESRIAVSTRVTSQWLRSRHLAIRIRDGLVRLASPYL